MSEDIAPLALRRDRVVAAAKASLIAAVCLLLACMALYDDSVDRAGIARDYLLTSRGGVMLVLGDIAPLPLRRIWGGPWTLYGMQCLAGSFGTVGMIALFRARMNRGRLSWVGLSFVTAALIVSFMSVVARVPSIYPTTIDRSALERALALVERREPGLLARLRAGERPALAATGGEWVRFSLSPAGRVALDLPPGTPLLRDREDGESLRFLLAERAQADGDLAMLRRLLPIGLAMPPADQPARYDFARRLESMGKAAGVAAVPRHDLERLRADAAHWRTMTGLTLVLRHLMQLALAIGVGSAVIGYVLRRRVATIERRQAALVGHREPPLRAAQPSRSFGRRVTET